jgi:hypothetical protein
MRSSVILWATDLVDEGFDLVLDRIRDMAGADTVTMAGNYHHSRDVVPHNPRRKVQFMNGGVYFRADPKVYSNLKIQPDIVDFAREDDPLAGLIDGAHRRGMQVRVWTNGMHSTVHGTAHPDCAVHNAFGDVYIHSLCPANPDVRAYVRAMAADLSRYDIESYMPESVCFMPFDHGYHHERTYVPISTTVKYLLSLCFCTHCHAAAKAAGVAVEALHGFVRTELEKALNGEAGALDDVPLQHKAIAALGAGEMGGFLKARELTVTTLVGEIAEAAGRLPVHPMEWSGGLRAAGGGMPVEGGTVGTACDRSWQDGVDVARLAELCGGLCVLGYVQDLGLLRSDLAGYRERAGAGTKLSVAVRPMPPDCDGPAALAAKLRVLEEMGVVGAEFYHYGFMRLANLAWIGQARSMAAGGRA